MMMTSTPRQSAYSLTGRRGRLALAAVTDSAPGSASWKVVVLNYLRSYFSTDASKLLGNHVSHLELLIFGIAYQITRWRLIL